MIGDYREVQSGQPETLSAEIFELINQLSDGGLSELHKLVQAGKFPDAITAGNSKHDLGEADVITTLYPSDLIRNYASIIQNFFKKQLRPGLRAGVDYSSPVHGRRVILLDNPREDDVKKGNNGNDQRFFTPEAIEVLKEAIKTGWRQSRYVYFPDDTPPIFRINSRFRRYIPSKQPWNVLAMLNVMPLESSLENKIFQLTDVGSVDVGFFSKINLVKNSQGKTHLHIYFSSLGLSIKVDLSGQKMKLITENKEQLQEIVKKLRQKYSLTSGDKDIMTTEENLQLLFKSMLLALQ